MHEAHLGDNFPILTSMESETIDFMLWDPPYNTQRTDMSYEDKLGRYEWLRFMELRLEQAWRLFKKTGIIAIHISHHELFRLGILMDDIFGAANKVSIITWECASAPKNCKRTISSTSDYILVYAKSIKHSYAGLLSRTDKQLKSYKYRDSNGIYCLETIESPQNHAKIHSNQIYGIMNPFTGIIHNPPKGREYRFVWSRVIENLKDWGIDWFYEGGVIKPVGSIESAEKLRASGYHATICFGVNGLAGPSFKRYLHDLKKSGYIPGNYWKSDFCQDISVGIPFEISGTNADGKRLIKDILESFPFSTPKPLKLTSLLIELFCPKDGIVLDAFGGSGTTAHAVLHLNDQGNHRRCILIEYDTDTFHTILKKRIENVCTGNWYKPRKDTKPLGSFDDWVFYE